MNSEINNQLDILTSTKEDIRSAIEESGEDINENEPFSSYGNKLRKAIESLKFDTDETLIMSEDRVLGVSCPVVPITTEDYNNLPEEKKMADALYLLIDSDGRV